MTKNTTPTAAAVVDETAAARLAILGEVTANLPATAAKAKDEEIVTIILQPAKQTAETIKCRAGASFIFDNDQTNTVYVAETEFWFSLTNGVVKEHHRLADTAFQITLRKSYIMSRKFHAMPKPETAQQG